VTLNRPRNIDSSPDEIGHSLPETVSNTPKLQVKQQFANPIPTLLTPVRMRSQKELHESKPVGVSRLTPKSSVQTARGSTRRRTTARTNAKREKSKHFSQSSDNRGVL